MRPGVIYRVISRLTWFTAAALVVPLVCSLGYRDGTWWAWLIPLVLSGLTAHGISHLPEAIDAPRDSLRRREGFLAVVLGWLVLVFFTAIAFNLTGQFPGFAEAFFESMSGFTTTGATVAQDIEALPESVLLMRSFAHWIGGMGIIVLSVAILPELSVGGMQLFSAEASGFDSDKLAPRIADTARRLWVLYVGITATLTVLLLFGGMGPFDAVNHAMSTIATGGFSTKNASIGHYQSLYIEIVIIVFMIVSGLSFALQYRAILGGEPRRLFRSPEVKLYATFLALAMILIAIDLYARGTYQSFGEALRKGSFTTAAIMTTTGFGTADFDAWPSFSKVTLVGLMMIGGCAGSTAGGSKVVRLYVVAQHAFIQLKRLIRPRLVAPLYLGDREVSRETTEAILGYYLLYFSATMLIGLAMAALGLDIVSAATASVSAMNSIGPGLGSVSAHFIDVPDPGLYIACFGMLLGRLEIYPVLVLLTIHFWRR